MPETINRTDAKNVVHAAYDFADNYEAHGGAGFWMILTMRDGRVFRGATWAPSDTVIQIDNYGPEAAQTDETAEPSLVWINIADVVTAEIEW